MNYFKRDNGFTLIEVLAVIIIIGVLAAIAIPKIASSSTNARQKADIATAHEVKAALDRYQLDSGKYPSKDTELTADGGTVTSSVLIPKYISKLDVSTTQQVAAEGKGGFEVLYSLTSATQYKIPDTTATNTIMIYLATDGLAAEVRAYDVDLSKVLWTSAN